LDQIANKELRGKDTGVTSARFMRARVEAARAIQHRCGFYRRRGRTKLALGIAIDCEGRSLLVTLKKNKKELWESIRAYHFDNLVPVHLMDCVREMFGGSDHSTRAFASKLNRKLGWKTEFALRAIAEYKKYVYLGVTSTKNVTPSKVIDQVWHEHQLFTKAYREFCRETIGKDFDHTPELVPIPEQTLLFNQQYLETIALYRAEFNVEPPAEVWAIPKFDRSLLKTKSSVEDRRIAGTNDSPLYLLVDSVTDGVEPSSSFHGFGGGTSGGAGATDKWSAPSHESTHSHSDAAHGGHGTDAGHGDSGGGSDGSGGGSDGGGSSCSSSCGGGGCGGS